MLPRMFQVVWPLTIVNPAFVCGGGRGPTIPSGQRATWLGREAGAEESRLNVD